MVVPSTLVFCLTGCGEPTPDAIKQISSAETDYRNQNYAAAEQKLTGYLKKYPDSEKSAQAYYLRSLCHTRRSNRVMAEADARQAIKLSTDGQLCGNAHATLATLLFESNRTHEALPHFKKALASLPDKPPADVLRFRYATALQREGDWPEAKRQFTEVSRRYPGSDLTGHARRALEWPHDAFSIQCGAYRDKSGAAALERKLKASGLKARQESRSRSGVVLHTVFVDRFNRYATAREALPRVQRVVPGAHIVP